MRLRSNDSKHKAALKHIHEAKVPRVFAFGAFDGDVPADAPILAAVEAAAVAHPELKFVVGDGALNPDTVAHFGLTIDDLPAAVVQDVTSGQKVYIQPRITQHDLDAFISDFQAGALVPKFKSEPMPNNNGVPVTVLVANNFEAVVGRRAATGKTVLLKFYTTWCGFCQQLAPIYEEVGKHFARRDDVVIAKMDADANSMTDGRFKLKSVPTLFLQTASGTASEYMGDHTKEAMIAFVEQQAALAGADTLKNDAVATELQAEL
jgi:protein disulfide-isomerase-like protein